MLKLFINTESRYPVTRSLISTAIENTLEERKMKGDIEVSVSIVGDRKMRELNKKYRNIDDTTDVLSFPLEDPSDARPFVDAPDNVMRLGDIVVSYPQAIEEATEENKLVDQKINELVEHGLLHLLGYHHD
ncbi:MAG: putative rRNA maturation factor [Candidatus Gottesmanbacteria bacterium GW2011_GWA2_41_12]|uniref:Endoribonuclease YbeY n=2 Tax=Candidatus Gottesmaniibacteriota TaxID=1752720 RepID=A0A0G0UHK9_9BACT|nr:MAG: putative rRNA maturation factor [Candidatus Gottesmanbacteria bacterium GW2011_GWC2_39_8]KKR88318.1 MAG: putative rRNA maturation factor [Candidatus Gottesmanbacteria bacterium GW2011_GWA2_41_12]